jgi:hypothetical protein
MNATSGGQRGRPPGLPKTGGRVRGTPNRSTAALQEKLATLGCDPMAELVKIAKDPKTETGYKVNIFSTLMRYTVPIPKPVGESGADQSTVGTESVFTMPELIKWAEYVVDHFGPNAAAEGVRSKSGTEVPTISVEEETSNERQHDDTP